VRVLLASDQWVTGGRFQNCAPYTASGRGWLAGDLASTGGVLNITAAACTMGFQWWRSGNITRTQNVSEYVLVLAVCLVDFVYVVFKTIQFVICIRLVLCQSKDVNLCCIDEDVFIRLHGPHVMV